MSYYIITLFLSLGSMCKGTSVKEIHGPHAKDEGKNT